MLLYSICYYYGKNKQSNIINHLNIFLKIKEEKEFILVAMVDDISCMKDVEQELSSFIKNYNPTIPFKIITEYNWGGTIVALWLSYLYGKPGDCIAQFEEDFYAINNDWYESAKELLTDDIIYVGEHIPLENNYIIKSNIKITYNPEFMSIINKYNNNNYDNICCWTDGGFYFSTISKLKQIEDKIGIFHKGSNSCKYDHYIDGITLGEVGFPTILYHNSFQFIGLYRHKYFIHI
jgi:hypothetical protein